MMTIWRHFAMVLAVLSMTAAASAQQDSDATETSEEEATEGAASATAGAQGESQENDAAEEEASDAEATEGAEAAEGPAEGQVYVAETYGDWTISCVKTETGNDPCRFTQTILNGEGGRVMQFSVVPLPPGQPVAAAAIIETPLGTLLRVPRNAEELSQPGGLRVQVDEGEIRVFQFTFCNPGGCIAEVGMPQELVDAFKAGAVANVTIWSAEAPDQPVRLPLSLTGFTAGIERAASLAGGGQQ